MQKLETISEIAKRTGLSRSYIRSLVNSGKVESIKMSPRKTLVPEGEFDAFIDANRVPANENRKNEDQ